MNWSMSEGFDFNSNNGALTKRKSNGWKYKKPIPDESSEDEEVDPQDEFHSLLGFRSTFDLNPAGSTNVREVLLMKRQGSKVNRYVKCKDSSSSLYTEKTTDKTNNFKYKHDASVIDLEKEEDTPILVRLPARPGLPPCIKFRRKSTETGHYEYVSSIKKMKNHESLHFKESSSGSVISSNGTTATVINTSDKDQYNQSGDSTEVLSITVDRTEAELVNTEEVPLPSSSQENLNSKVVPFGILPPDGKRIIKTARIVLKFSNA